LGVRSIEMRAKAVEHRCARCAPVRKALERYFSGDADALADVPVDLSLARTEFHRRVLATLRDAVPAGSTITYGGLAAAVGKPGAARAVGSAMANNPVPIIVPCHRVLRSGGDVGNYGGGPKMKRYLLELEGFATPAAG
jgi:methylated-DNA-[protein]-cysteine S-methyltransferase